MTLHYAAVVAKFISIHRVHLSTRKFKSIFCSRVSVVKRLRNSSVASVEKNFRDRIFKTYWNNYFFTKRN